MTSLQSFLTFACTLLVLGLSSCASLTPSQQIEKMFQKTVQPPPKAKALTREEIVAQRKDMDRRAERTRKLVEDDELTSAEDAYRAAVILYESQQIEDIVLAQELALRAYEDGLEDGVRIVAHCMDRSCMMRGKPQRFGTQLVYEHVLEKWRLWNVDPVTTDAEREAFGVPPLSVLQDRVGYLNDRQ